MIFILCIVAWLFVGFLSALIGLLVQYKHEGFLVVTVKDVGQILGFILLGVITVFCLITYLFSIHDSTVLFKLDNREKDKT